MSTSQVPGKQSPARDVFKGPDVIQEKALIMSGFGINSEMETQEVLLRAGMRSDIVHINDLIDGRTEARRVPPAGVPRWLLVR